MCVGHLCPLALPLPGEVPNLTHRSLNTNWPPKRRRMCVSVFFCLKLRIHKVTGEAVHKLWSFPRHLLPFSVGLDSNTKTQQPCSSRMNTASRFRPVGVCEAPAKSDSGLGSNKGCVGLLLPRVELSDAVTCLAK